MAKGINENIKNKISDMPAGEIFFTSSFNEIASLTTIRKCLGRLVEEKSIKRISDGIYEKPRYNELIKAYIPTNPEALAYALAKKYHWTIAPSGAVALNKLGLSTQVPNVWTFISDGPYRDFECNNIIISFKHKTNREISQMSKSTIILIEAIKSLGKDSVDNITISTLRNRFSPEEKRIMLEETKDVTSWVYDVIREVCR